MNDDEKMGFGCFVVIVVLFCLCAFTQPGQVIWESITNNLAASQKAPGNPSITNTVYEPVKTSDVLIFPAGTKDWRVIAYAINATTGDHDADTLVIEYWCRFEGDDWNKWTRCYPAAGTAATS